MDKFNTVAHAKSQRGATLIIALILLLIITMVALSGVETVTLEEKMTANTYDRSLAFQSAEAGLRVGEAIALAQSQSDNDGFDNEGKYTDAGDTCGASPCQNGLCSQPDKDCPDRWLDSGFNGWQTANGTNIGSMGSSAQYFVEFLGDDYLCDPDDKDSAPSCSRYRVTARSNQGAERASVILQSIYATE
jgi:type IV pilus assembly protein PilX